MMDAEFPEPTIGIAATAFEVKMIHDYRAGTHVVVPASEKGLKELIATLNAQLGQCDWTDE